MILPERAWAVLSLSPMDCMELMDREIWLEKVFLSDLVADKHPISNTRVL